MGDSPDNSDGLPWETGAGDAPDDNAPSAAELEDVGQGSMFGAAEAEPAAPQEKEGKKEKEKKEVAIKVK